MAEEFIQDKPRKICVCSGAPYDDFIDLVEKGNDFLTVVTQLKIGMACATCLSSASSIYKKYKPYAQD